MRGILCNLRDTGGTANGDMFSRAGTLEIELTAS